MDTIEQVNFQRLIGHERPAQLKLLGLAIGPKNFLEFAAQLNRLGVERLTVDNRRGVRKSHTVATPRGSTRSGFRKSLLHRSNTYFSSVDSGP